MRLPQPIRLNEPTDNDFIQALKVKVSRAGRPPQIIVGLYSAQPTAHRS